MRQNRILLIIAAIILFVLSLLYDKQILLFVTQNRIELLNPAFIFLDKINGLAIFSIFLIYFLIKKQYKTIKPYLLNIVIVTIITYGLKFLISRPRPTEEFLPLIIKSGLSSNFSFPSGHTTAAFSILLFLETKEEIITWIIISSFLAILRLYLGVHYLSDVLSGVVLGLFLAYIAKKSVK
ncbi:hypothetical protein CL617_04475 [archaeon]|jgi:undecaprenyl-diphosphatase|nr:hypothetical protein [archaeon]|tara:strand:+ start:2151 stop:2693 length:543 start_codon:yes stop_codon:yes gene_type:complete